MPDGLTSTATAPTTPGPGRSARAVVVLQVAVVLVALAAAGALCGLLWHRLWDAPQGVVSGGQWFTDETGLRQDFAGTGWYVAVAALAGLALGVVLAWACDRSELATLVAVVVGSALAGYLMLRVGYHLSPPDPDTLARTADDGTRLDGALRVPGLAPKLAFPFGALLGLMLVYFMTTGRRHRADPPPTPSGG